MATIKVRDHEAFDSALRRFKRANDNEGILDVLKEKEYYEKPTWKRKRKAAAAVKCRMADQRRNELPPKQY